MFRMSGCLPAWMRVLMTLLMSVHDSTSRLTVMPLFFASKSLMIYCHSALVLSE